MVYYDAQSINPFNHHPARQVRHKVKDCPLLNKWEGRITEVSHPLHKPNCPFCFNKKILTKVQKAERLWNLTIPSSFVAFLNAYLETTRSRRTLEKEMELM